MNLVRKLSLSALAFVLVASGLSLPASAGSSGQCVQRLSDSGCVFKEYAAVNYFSQQATSCKYLNSRSGKTSQLVMELQDGRLATLKVKASQERERCDWTVYRFTASNNWGQVYTQPVNDLKIIGVRGFFLAEGRLFYLLSDASVYEVLNTKGSRYSNIQSISGAPARGKYKEVFNVEGSGYAFMLTVVGGDLYTLKDNGSLGSKRQVVKVEFTRDLN